MTERRGALLKRNTTGFVPMPIAVQAANMRVRLCTRKFGAALSLRVDMCDC